MQPDQNLDEVLAFVRLGEFDRAFERLPPGRSKADGLRYLGDLIQRAGYHQDAVACYDEALRCEPALQAPRHNRAVALKALGQYDQAEADLKTCLEQEPDVLHLHQTLADVYFLAGKFDESIASYDRALSIGGNSRLLRYRRNKSVLARENKLDDPAEVFGNIYAHHAWGNDSPDRKFYSGEGSHRPQTVKTYVEAVTGFLGSFAQKPHVVDVGCGDFNIGSQIYPSAATYQAFDVVPALVAHNQQAFRDTGVAFACLDITRQSPPDCDVLFIREVFQHLSNAQIARALANIEGRFRYFVFTEVEPKGTFTPNKDKPAGENIRLNLNRSAVILTEPPFSVRFASERLLCAVEVDSALIKTYVYTPA